VGSLWVTRGREERNARGLGVKAWRKETTRKTEA
jgi:hypothetical protein